MHSKDDLVDMPTGEPPSCLWASYTLFNILTDERYTGMYIAGKTKATDVGSGRQIKLDESQWIKMPGKHPAVIEKSAFDEAQEKIRAFRRKSGYKLRQTRDYPLKGKVYCGCCNHAMQRDPIKDPIYRCRRTKANPDADCFNMAVRESDIDKLLMAIIRSQLKILLNVDETFDLSKLNKETVDQRERQTQISQLDDEKRCLYERFVSQEISKDEYRSQKTTLDGKMTRLRQQQVAAKERSEQMQAAAKRYDKLKKVADETRYKHGLTHPLVDALIEKVLIFPDNRIKILWKSEDFAITERKDADNENSGYLLPNGIERRYRHRKSAESIVPFGV